MRTQLNLSDTIYFGKHKGRVIAQVIAEDLSYVCWLREEQRQADSRENTFSFETNHVIDLEIAKNKSVSKKFKPWNLKETAKADSVAAHMTKVKAALVALGTMTNEVPTPGLPVEVECRCVQPDGWGSW